MKKEIKEMIQVPKVIKCELYCDECKKKINHNEIYWEISCNYFFRGEKTACSMACADKIWHEYCSYPRACFDGDFHCRAKYWDEYTGSGKVNDYD